MICKCGCKRYKIIEAVEGSGEITVRCMACPCEYKCTGVYPISMNMPGAEQLPDDQALIEVKFTSGLGATDE